jgi:hypothetical protein
MEAYELEWLEPHLWEIRALLYEIKERMPEKKNPAAESTAGQDGSKTLPLDLGAGVNEVNHNAQADDTLRK